MAGCWLAFSPSKGQYHASTPRRPAGQWTPASIPSVVPPHSPRCTLTHKSRNAVHKTNLQHAYRPRVHQPLADVGLWLPHRRPCLGCGVVPHDRAHRTQVWDRQRGMCCPGPAGGGPAGHAHGAISTAPARPWLRQRATRTRHAFATNRWRDAPSQPAAHCPLVPRVHPAP